MELPSRPLDEGEAGAVWRSHRLRTLESRLQGLDLGDEQAAEVVALLQRVREETAVLDAMWQAQRAPDYQPRWWQDGELDRERADRHNDAGTAALAAGNPGPAFEEFTQAIRLWPSSPAYHSNRAAAALKLARFGVAAEDARDALRLDPGSARAALRLAKAQAGSRDPAAAAAIACGRWEDAGAAVAGMDPGLDADYLRAEVAWRRGDVASALTLLGQGGQSGAAAVPDDATDGSRRAAGHEAMTEGSRSAAERGSVIDGQDATEPGSPEQPARTPGPPPLPDKMKDLAAFLAPISVLLAAADAAEEEGIQEDVADACGAALDHLLACAGDGLRAAAAAATGGSGLASSDASRSALSTLGIEGGAAVTHASLRAAYRRGGGAGHPDKWGGRGEEARLAAEERFKVVQLAYEELQACVS
ncbi:Small glutamine-rich tetratricopeptide repeat-containing protein 2 [Auxenochlorella protothecoides]|uniref:Small glutamine-rich tetratricopeptide repeat-containing protein 2 n=1 Tax=Auxenochlorella protothecoides TaxID=3075 RepID=A0A087SQ37_AUXPR|nr:Small glutamine-rich tetratricopeptide repeat-containing protein 2 [Auxenochlorella protothecoides]KFM27841.1 Small glutamine-rich tetratricopeptide repeat-containing protein 2 [Auxenochlorella protothecoides]